MIVPLLALTSLVCQSHAKIDVKKPVMFSISPKLWTLFGLEADFINSTIKSIKIPEIDKKKGATRLRIYGGQVDNFSLDEKSVTFKSMSDGIHLNITNVQYRVTIKMKLNMGKKIFGKFISLVNVNGDIIGTSKNASVDIQLKWNDFKFTPVVKVNLELCTELKGGLKKYKKLVNKVEKQMMDKITARVQQKLTKLIEKKVNPTLQEMKPKFIGKNSAYSTKFEVVNNTQIICLLPNNTSATQLEYPINKDRMVCVRATKVDQQNTNRNKRAAEITQTTSSSGKVNTPRKLIITCVYPERKCKDLQCTYCTDIDVSFSSTNATKTIQNCSPNF